MNLYSLLNGIKVAGRLQITNFVRLVKCTSDVALAHIFMSIL